MVRRQLSHSESGEGVSVAFPWSQAVIFPSSMSLKNIFLVAIVNFWFFDFSFLTFLIFFNGFHWFSKDFIVFSIGFHWVFNEIRWKNNEILWKPMKSLKNVRNGQWPPKKIRDILDGKITGKVSCDQARERKRKHPHRFVSGSAAGETSIAHLVLTRE